VTRVYVKRGNKVELGKGLSGVPIGGGGGGGPVSAVPRFFASNTFWNTKLPDNAEIVNDSNNYAQKIRNQIMYTDKTDPGSFYTEGWNTTINTSQYTPPLYRVPPGTPRQTVTWMTNNSKGPPASQTQNFGLQAAINAVPIPVGKTAAQLRSAGTDQEVAFYDPETKEIWEFWHFRDDYTGADEPWRSTLTPSFNCGVGGYISNLETDDGVYQTTPWGTRASGLSIFGGLMMMHEYLNGGFPHMLVCGVLVVKNPFITPATRNDQFVTTGARGGSYVDAVPEGTIVRLPPGYEPAPSQYPIVKMMAHAIRDYGLIVGDATQSTFNFYAENPKTVSTGMQIAGLTTNIWSGIVQGNVNMRKDLRNKIDWSLLQQVKWPQAGWPG
jgi:hypothetical protein